MQMDSALVAVATTIIEKSMGSDAYLCLAIMNPIRQSVASVCRDVSSAIQLVLDNTVQMDTIYKKRNASQIQQQPLQQAIVQGTKSLSFFLLFSLLLCSFVLST